MFIKHLYHADTRTGWGNDVFRIRKNPNKPFSKFACIVMIPGIESRLTTTRLVARIDNLSAKFLQKLCCRNTNFRVKLIGKTGNKKGNAHYNVRITFAGLPATTVLAGTSLVITLPAPTMAFSPIVTPQRIVALVPIDARRFTSVETTFQSLSFCNEPSLFVDRGYLSLMKETL